MDGQKKRQNYNEYIEKARALHSQGHNAAADRCMEEGLANFPREMWMYFHYAAIAANRGEHYLEIHRWRSFVEFFPEITEGYAHLCNALLKEKFVTQAFKVIEGALLRFGPEVTLLESMAKAQEVVENWDAAVYFWSFVNKQPGRTMKDLFSLKSFESISFECPINVFQYWSGQSNADHPSTSMWRHILSRNLTVIGDRIIANLIYELDEEFVDLYNRIRIPACKADVARLIYLETHGGLYLDMHCTLGDLDAFKNINLMLDGVEAVFFAYKDKTNIGNSIILSKKGSDVIKHLRKKVINNLKTHFEAEKTSKSHIPYNIYQLTGPWVYQAELMSESQPSEINPSLAEKVNLQTLTLNRASEPVIPFYFYNHRTPGNHWSERQQTESLFYL